MAGAVEICGKKIREIKILTATIEEYFVGQYGSLVQ